MVQTGVGHPGTPGESRPPTWEGLGDLLVSGILPAHQGLLPSSAGLGQHQAHHSLLACSPGPGDPPASCLQANHAPPAPTPVRVRAARGVGEG